MRGPLRHPINRRCRQALQLKTESFGQFGQLVTPASHHQQPSGLLLIAEGELQTFDLVAIFLA